jgi:hypothetical protein
MEGVIPCCEMYMHLNGLTHELLDHLNTLDTAYLFGNTEEKCLLIHG